MVKVYFVSLIDYPEHWEAFQDRTLEARQSTGVEIELIQAVDTRNNIFRCREFGLELDPVGLFQQFYFSCGNGAVGCYLSHYTIWKKIIEQGVDYGVCVEDDASYRDIADLIKSEEIPVICKDYELVQLNTREVTQFSAKHPDDIYTTYTGFDGTEAYVVSNSGARKLIQLSHDHDCFQDTVLSYTPDLWLNRPGLVGIDRKVETAKHFPILSTWKDDYTTKNTLCAAADKFLGLACWPTLPKDKGLTAGFHPVINLRPGGEVSDILHDTKGYWQMDNNEFMQFVLSRKFMHFQKDRLIVKDFTTAPDENSFVVVCVGRDEQLLIPKFVEHYENLGATHFIYVDNNSVDSSVNTFLTNCNVDCRVVHTCDSYAESDYGLTWVHEELLDYCKDTWCAVVDIDEFLMFRDHETFGEYSEYLEQNNYNVGQTVLVEFYPKQLGAKCGDDPFEHSDHYDKFEDKNMYYTDTAPDGSIVIKGGVRQRVFTHFPGPANNESCCLVKKSFFKYDFYDSHKISVGMHWTLPYEFVDWSYEDWQTHAHQIRIDPQPSVLVHFKFVEQDLSNYFQTRVDRGQDWNNSEEYKKYVDNIPETFYDEGTSIRYTNRDELYKNTVNLINIQK